MNFFDASQIDLKKLPTEAVKAIYWASLQELRRRRESTRAQASLTEEFENDRRKFAGLKNPAHKYNSHWNEYLKVLIAQDWEPLFSGDAEEKYYVYLHVQPSGKRIDFSHDGVSIKTNGHPFYVGKGTGGRAFDLNRNQGHGAILRQLMQGGGATADDVVFIVKDRMSEPAALALESKLIYFFGTRYEQGRKGLLVNLDIPIRPELF